MRNIPLRAEHVKCRFNMIPIQQQIDGSNKSFCKGSEAAPEEEGASGLPETPQKPFSKSALDMKWQHII